MESFPDFQERANCSFFMNFYGYLRINGPWHITQVHFIAAATAADSRQHQSPIARLAVVFYLNNDDEY